MIMPDLFAGWGENAKELSFGRIRPMHTTLAIFAFVANAAFAAVYYSTQRLCKTAMWSKPLSWLHFFTWQALVVAMVVSPFYGHQQAREFSEPEWLLDAAFAVIWILFFGVNFFATIFTRRHKPLFISLWFYIATVIGVALVHLGANLAIPQGPWDSWPMFSGARDAMAQWWYGHNGVFFLMTMPFLGMMYYFVPKAAGKPIYSYKLAVVQFWAMVLVYFWAGPHQLHFSTVPEFVSSQGMWAGLLLFAPALGGMFNGLLTIRSAKEDVESPPSVANKTVLSFFTAALVFYGISTFGMTLQSIKTFNGVSQYTDWTIAQAHALGLGFDAMLIFGIVYFLVPKLFQLDPPTSPGLPRAHYIIGGIGLLLVTLPIYAGGLMQGLNLMSLNPETGGLTEPDFLTTLQPIKVLWWLRLIGGLFVLAGVLIIIGYVKLSWFQRTAGFKPSTELYEQTGLNDPPKLDILLADAPMLEVAKRMSLWNHMHWHRLWERSSFLFVWITVGSLALVGMLQLAPVLLLRGSVPEIPAVRPYTPLELAGREIYLQEGCVNCHTQMVRPLVAETKRYGEFSQAGETVFDFPNQFGSRRIGPDLARESGKQTSHWHWIHLINPRDGDWGDPRSIMPSFEHLSKTPLDFDRLGERMEVAIKRGAKYEFKPEQAAEHARKQAESIAADVVGGGGPIWVQRPSQEPMMTFDTQAIALIAYLQRLGADLTNPQTPPK